MPHPPIPRAILAGALVLVMLLSGVACVAAQDRPPGVREIVPAFTVDGAVALHSLQALGDGYLQKTSDVLTLLSTTDAARSGDWEQIRPLLESARGMTAPALHWFALPDGSYWSLEQGRADASLADRPYFPRLRSGESVTGDLVVSRATGRSTAIVAVPVRGTAGDIVGALGTSIYLDSLSAKIRSEMQLEPNHLFFSLDAEPLVGLHADPQIIFLHPLEEGDEDLSAAIREILSRDEGFVSYEFRGQTRQVLYRRSPLSRWWYAFGVLR
jgi:hypothetical protein